MRITGKLYLVATPIGNLKDISYRAKEVLHHADVVLAEDTRIARKLLQSLEIEGKRLFSYYQDNELRRLPQVLTWLKQGKSVALVSNAGTPLLADPGFKLVREVLSQGGKIESIPGPSAFLLALTLSGFPPDRFVFFGFLPKRGGRKKRLFQQWAKMEARYFPTAIFYEGPTRLRKTLELLEDVFPQAEVALCWELTKKFERIIRGSLKEVLEKMRTAGKMKGEVTVVIKRQK